MLRKIGDAALPDFKVYIAEQFDEQLQKFSKKDKAFIEKKMGEYIIPQLKSAPHFGSNIKKVRNYNPPIWRYRIGKYRIFYAINNAAKEVDILTISHRKSAY